MKLNECQEEELNYPLKMMDIWRVPTQFARGDISNRLHLWQMVIKAFIWNHASCHWALKAIWWCRITRLECMIEVWVKLINDNVEDLHVISSGSCLFLLKTYHNASSYGNTPATVSIRDNITISNGQECDRYKPHGVQQICMFFIVGPVGKNNKKLWRRESEPTHHYSTCHRDGSATIRVRNNIPVTHT